MICLHDSSEVITWTQKYFDKHSVWIKVCEIAYNANAASFDDFLTQDKSFHNNSIELMFDVDYRS